MANDTFQELRGKIDSNDPFMSWGHQIIKPRSNDRKNIPEWALDDKKIREILLRSFPKLTTNSRQRRGAARWMRVVHLYFRMHMTRGQVAEELRVKSRVVKDVVQNIRRAAEGRRCDGQGKKLLGIRPVGRPKIHAPIRTPLGVTPTET